MKADQLRWLVQAVVYDHNPVHSGWVRAVIRRDGIVAVPDVGLAVSLRDVALPDDGTAVGFLAWSHGKPTSERALSRVVGSPSKVIRRWVRTARLYRAVLRVAADTWCARYAMEPLATLVPAYVEARHRSAPGIVVVSNEPYVDATDDGTPQTCVYRALVFTAFGSFMESFLRKLDAGDDRAALAAWDRLPDQMARHARLPFNPVRVCSADRGDDGTVGSARHTARMLALRAALEGFGLL